VAVIRTAFFASFGYCVADTLIRQSRCCWCIYRLIFGRT